MAMPHMSHIVKINVFMVCILLFLIKLVYFSTVNLDTFRVVVSNEMKYIYRISPANF
jgi:hypothetical protein